MNHKRILNKLASDMMVEAVDDDVSLAVSRAMPPTFRRDDVSQDEINSTALSMILKRWNCVLLADDDEEHGVSKHYKAVTTIALATTFHKYGLSDPAITEQAIEAIDHLNDHVVLGDAFYHQTPEIKAFLQTEPKTLTRRPSTSKTITFYRADDIISFQFDDKFLSAYVHSIERINSYPIVEFYDQVFNKRPSIEDIKANRQAFGNLYNDGVRRKSKFSVIGLKFLPDLSNQVHLIKACATDDLKPDNRHLEESIGFCTIYNIFEIQQVLEEIILQ